MLHSCVLIHGTYTPLWGVGLAAGKVPARGPRAGCRASRWLMVAVVLALLGGCQQQEAGQEFRLGDPAPDFAARDLEGGVVVLSSLRGRPVILRFFETGCRFCRADTPVITNLYQRYREQGLVVLYIGSFYDQEAALRAFIDELGVEFPVVMDESAKLADLYRIRVYPQTLFISPDGRLLGALLGAVGEAEVREIFGEHLQAQ